MKAPSRRTRTLVSTVVAVAALGVLLAIYWMNGAEKEDAWLYLGAAGLVLWAAFGAGSGMKKEKAP